MQYLPYIIMAVAGTIMLFQIWKKGFKGAVFGGRILKTVDEIQLSEEGQMKGHIKIHTLESKGKVNIGIEVVQKSMMSYDMTALNFERKDILELIKALGTAIEDSEQAYD